MKKINWKLILCVVVIALYLVSIGLFFARKLPIGFFCFGVSTFLGVLMYIAGLRQSRQQAPSDETDKNA